MPDALSPSAPALVKPENVAFATPDDEEAIYSFLVSLWAHNERGWGTFYDPSIVARQIEVGTRPDPATRTDPTDLRRGVIGIIRGDDRRIVASVGLFIMPVMWFTSLPGLTELWLHVRPEAKNGGRLSRDLFAFSLWAHNHMKADLSDWNAPFYLQTGFLHLGKRLEVMESLWTRRSGAKKAGVLFVRK